MMLTTEQKQELALIQRRLVEMAMLPTLSFDACVLLNTAASMTWLVITEDVEATKAMLAKAER